MRPVARAFSLALSLLGLAVAGWSVPASAQTTAPLQADTFRLGQGGGLFCQAQARTRDAALSGYFDRAWTVICPDSARPVARVYALRGEAVEIAARLAARRQGEATCEAPTNERDDVLGAMGLLPCQLDEARIGYRVLELRRGNVTYVAEGLAAYDSALRLALRTVIANRIVPGQIDVAASAVDDPAAFARLQAGTLDPDQALAEGYRRNNSGNYAEAAEFFDTLQQRAADSAQGLDREPRRLAEYRINQALQKSNLGEFAEAEALFALARGESMTDRVLSRLRRNYETIHLLNQQRLPEALARLDQPVAAIDAAPRLPTSAIEIGAEVAAEIDAGLPVNQRLGVTESSALSPEERATLLDAQSLHLRGALLRLSGRTAEAGTPLAQALATVLAVRGGRVTSAMRLRSEILVEEGLVAEARGDGALAETRLREALSVLETFYPQSAAVNGARTRLAAFLVRQGKPAAARAEYRQVVDRIARSQVHATALANRLQPYLDILVADFDRDPAAAAEMFALSQLLIRPGIADTQAILARELSEGSADASRLYRQARALERDIERARIELAGLVALENPGAEVRTLIDATRRDIAALEDQQVETQARLAEFSQYRAIAARAMTLDELNAMLREGEAYFRLIALGDGLYAFLADAQGYKAYRLGLSTRQLDRAVDALRDTIALTINGQTNTYPFDVELGRKTFLDLFGPVADRVLAARHLIFEPDGPMLKLPINLLVAGQSGLDAYRRRIASPGGDEFDFTGIEWLGRGRAISTTISARAIADARSLRRSSAARQYIGFGENLPVGPQSLRASLTRSGEASGIDCSWSPATWANPISAAELRDAQALFGTGAEVVTGSSFTDRAIRERADLADYRILHFATHGLVSAPSPECPARPALLTSFGDGGSDGLLSFSEIFDLRLDADLVILSACNTAATASVSATREAGVTSGGGNALDGLVRAFIGAGSRTVLASHWPAPDDFDATRRLVSGTFTASDDAGVAMALARAQAALMDDPDTSHPYYWSGFAVIGDGAQSLRAGSGT
ncbi:MAG TPA: CHAT domain-containing protein [Novosphingobium sp.]|nr:CHAT domain-containing protein [Novosphingobium sp.]